MSLLKQSTARNISFFMTNSTDSISGLTGATVTPLISQNGGAFASPAGTVTEIGNGWYYIAFTAVDTGTLGDLILHCTAPGADPTDTIHQVVVDLPGASVASVTGSVGSVTAAVTIAAGSVQAIWNALTSALTTAGSIGQLLVTNINAAIGSIPTNPLLTNDARLNNLDTTVSSRLASTGYTAPNNAGIASIETAVAEIPTNPLLTNDTRLNNLDVAVSSRLAASSYVAPNNAGISALETAVAAIPTNPLLTTDTRLNNLDVAVSSRLATSGYVAPDNAGIAAIQTQTDLIPENPAMVTFARNAAYNGFTFPMSSPGGLPLTGLTVTAMRSIDGGALAACANPVNEVGSGLYTINLTAADMNGKNITLELSATGATTTQALLVTEG